MSRLAARASAAVLALLPAAALAHQAGVSYGTWTARADGVDLRVRLRADELVAAAPERAPRDGTPTNEERLARVFLEGVRASRAGAACGAEAGPARRVAPDGLELEARLRCPAAGAEIQVELEILSRLPPGHVHLARVAAGSRTQERIADAGRPSFVVDARAGRLAQAAHFLALGVEHTFTGWDHVAFLLGLLLAAARLRDVLRSLTAFTAAHALTLALATFGVANPPAGLVEPLIAASVVLVAAANLVDLRRRRGTSPLRLPLTLAFGLVHGFGFAGALAGLHPSSDELAFALGGFNLGVELGQAIIALAVFPALRLLRRSPRAAVPGLAAGSAAVAAAGLLWLAERLPW